MLKGYITVKSQRPYPVINPRLPVLS